jgi:hypothetical protein
MASDANEIELTGLADLGSVRMVCLRVEHGRQNLTLRLGETAGGITVKRIDFRSKTATVESGTNEVQLRLVSYCASGPSEASVASAQNPSNRSVASGTASGHAVAGSGALQDGPHSSRLPDGTVVEGNLAGGGGGQPGAHLTSTTTGRAAVESGAVPAVDPSGQQLAATPEGVSASPTGEPSQDENWDSTDPLQAERDRILAFNGHGAFLAWDRAQNFRVASTWNR